MTRDDFGAQLDLAGGEHRVTREREPDADAGQLALGDFETATLGELGRQESFTSVDHDQDREDECN